MNFQWSLRRIKRTKNDVIWSIIMQSSVSTFNSSVHFHVLQNPLASLFYMHFYWRPQQPDKVIKALRQERDFPTKNIVSFLNYSLTFEYGWIVVVFFSCGNHILSGSGLWIWSIKRFMVWPFMFFRKINSF